MCYRYNYHIYSANIDIYLLNKWK